MNVRFKSKNDKRAFDIDQSHLMTFLSKHKGEIDTGKLSEVYNAWPCETRSYLTYVFLNSGIDPLDYMTEIPANYADLLAGLYDYLAFLNPNIRRIGEEAFAGCKDLGEVDLSNVEEIGNAAFAESSIDTLYLSDKLTTLHSGIFAETYIKDDIIFDGTMETYNSFCGELFGYSYIDCETTCNDGVC